MENSSTDKPKRVRSSSYPAVNLDKAIERAQIIKNNLGKGPFSRESAARALGYSGLSGKSTTVIAALVHYGLLARKADTYTISELTDAILTYRDESERKTAVLKAAQTPKLYSSLIKAYEGRSLPAMMGHILARDYGINERVAPQVAKTFAESMTFAGLLVNGVLTLPSNAVHDGEILAPARTTTVPDTSVQSVAPRAILTNNAEMQQITVTDGVFLSYRSELAFNPEFAAALKAFKVSVERLNNPTGQNPVNEAENEPL
jgi:hypothetical protein